MYYISIFRSKVPSDIFSLVMKAGFGGNVVIWRPISSSLYSPSPSSTIYLGATEELTASEQTVNILL